MKMYHALVHYPQIDTTFIEEFRKTYDPYFQLAKVHITFLFGIPDVVQLADLEKHIRSVLSSWEPFPISIKDINMSWDQCMYLGIEEGNDSILLLHDELYGGMLQEFLRNDIPFNPHLGIGIFSKQSYDPENPTQYDLDEEKYNKAFVDTEKIEIGYRCNIDKLTLIRIDNNFKEIIDLVMIPH